MSMQYFWKDGKVLTSRHQGYKGAEEHSACECFCFDGHEAQTAGMDMYMYGWYVESGGWRSKERSEFPKEFLTHLLIMGVLS